MLCGAEREPLGQDPPSKDTSWKAPGDLAGRRSMGSCYINKEQKSIRLPLVTPANKQRKFHSKKKNNRQTWNLALIGSTDLFLFLLLSLLSEHLYHRPA